MQCRKCGAENPEWSANQSPELVRFCVKCGEQLAAPEADAPTWGRNQRHDPVNLVTEEAPAVPEPDMSRGDTGKLPALDVPAPVTEPKKKNRAVWVILGVVAALAALAAVGYFTIHSWQPATCTEAAVCSICGKVQGEPNGHDWKSATCTEPKVCTVCGKTEGAALGHHWSVPTATVPRTCARCGEKLGSALHEIGAVTGEFSDRTISVGNNDGAAFVFDTPLVNCYRMTVHFFLAGDYSGDPFGSYAVYAHSKSEGWFRAQGFWVKESDVDQDVATEITFKDENTIDQIFIVYEEDGEWSIGYSIYVDGVATA